MVKPFYSAALGRLIEQVVDSGFLIKKNERSLYFKSIKPETSFLYHINKNGGTPFPKSTK